MHLKRDNKGIGVIGAYWGIGEFHMPTICIHSSTYSSISSTTGYSTTIGRRVLLDTPLNSIFYCSSSLIRLEVSPVVLDTLLDVNRLQAGLKPFFFQKVSSLLQCTPSVYSTRHLSSAEDKNFPFCPQLRTQKTYGKQTVFSKPSTMAYLTMVVLPSWQLLTQY